MCILLLYNIENLDNIRIELKSGKYFLNYNFNHNSIESNLTQLGIYSAYILNFFKTKVKLC